MARVEQVPKEWIEVARMRREQERTRTKARASADLDLDLTMDTDEGGCGERSSFGLAESSPGSRRRFSRRPVTSPRMRRRAVGTSRDNSPDSRMKFYSILRREIETWKFVSLQCYDLRSSWTEPATKRATTRRRN